MAFDFDVSESAIKNVLYRNDIWGACEMSYQDLIESKKYQHIDAGFDASEMWTPELIKDFQKDIVMWACRRGRAAVFADTGLGKTLMQLSWARLVAEKTGLPVLILAPLCVAQQTVEEGRKFGINAMYIREPQISGVDIHVTNYEMLKKFRAESYGGIVLDESSILKGMDGKLRKSITDFGRTIPYRLSCTATPSPNDFMELGTQSEFLGIMSQVEMLATFFIHDGSDTSKWRLKGHARKRFWEWLATWACVIRKPSDLGYEKKAMIYPHCACMST
jgi:DNA or RNA helicases of superfamily II